MTKSENQNKKNDSTSCDSCFDIYLLYSYWRYFCIYEWCSYACKDNCSGSSGKKLEMLGLVKGSTIQTKNVGKDIMQSFKNLVGGELTAYNEMMNDARALATKRMVVEAEQLGADAVVNIRYASSAIAAGAAEVIAYGTAVKFMGDE